MSSPEQTTTNTLYATHDFIRPGEQSLYDELDNSLSRDLVPVGILEHNLVDEIRRAMWRLRRCGVVEESLASLDNASTEPADPMQNDSPIATQLNVDRARSQAHRLLHRCTIELRKLQTDRRYRNESFEAGTDISHLGICDLAAVEKDLTRVVATSRRKQKQAEMDRLDALLDAPLPSRPPVSSFCKNEKDADPMPRAA
jgi:hypothetical protein